jgi:hypothetical protein
MSVDLKYEWFPLFCPDLPSFQKCRESYHHAIQIVSGVGRSYIETDTPEFDENATLSWIPGLWRMAGKWVQGNSSFRSSVGFREFAIFLVDQKVNTLGAHDIAGHNYRELMIWLEEKIISQNLSSSELTTDLPYQLPDYAQDIKKVFDMCPTENGELLGGYFHDAFILLSSLKETHIASTETLIYPHHFDMEVKVLLKETGEMSTNTFVRLGFSPGDELMSAPYLYINSWPNLSADSLPKAPGDSHWETEEYVGLMLPLSFSYDKDNQYEYLMSFYNRGLALFTSKLLD